ncbi:MAG: hypothetical protein AAF702_16340 [Chloroflexota bacterium]
MNKKLSYLLIALVLIVATVGIAFAQFSIGTPNPDPSAALDIVSTTQGVLHPRLTTAQRDAINGGTFAEGLTIYNTEDKCLQVWDGTSWNCIVGGSSSPATSSASTSSYVNIMPPKTYDGYSWGDQTWLNDDTFATVALHIAGLPSITPYGGELRVTIYNGNFAEQDRFPLPDPGIAAAAVSVATLANGNLVYTARDGGVQWGVLITAPDGTVVKNWELRSGRHAREINVLDDGRFVVSLTLPAGFALFEEDGTFVREHTLSGGGDYNGRVSIAPTNFGFALSTISSSGTTHVTEFYLYDSATDQLTAHSLETDPSKPFAGSTFPSGYAPVELTRVDGNILYAAVRRPRTSNVTPAVDEYNDSASPTDHYLTALKKFEVDVNGTITTLAELETDPEIGVNHGIYHDKRITAHSDGRLFTFGALIPDIQLGGYEIPTGSAKYQSMGHSIPVLQFDTNAAYSSQLNLVNEAARRYNGPRNSITLPYNDNFVNSTTSSPHDVISLSPSGTHLFVGYYRGSSSRNSQGVHQHILDPATMTVRPVQLQANSQPQDLRQQFVVLDPENNIDMVEVTIIDGAGSSDTLNYFGAAPDINGNYSGANKRLRLTNTGSATSQDFSNASAHITFAPDTAIGTRTFEVAVFNADHGLLGSNTFTVEVVAP